MGKVAEQCWFKHMDILSRDLLKYCVHARVPAPQLDNSNIVKELLLITGILSFAHIHAARLSLSIHHSHITSPLV